MIDIDADTLEQIRYTNALDRLRWEPTCDVETAASLLGISRGLAYQQARTGSLGGIPVLRIGHRLRVVAKPLLDALVGPDFS
ncbi:MAG TPA: hypothetical protein VIK32_00180 [Candidatus Limnocylindrales bacterium]